MHDPSSFLPLILTSMGGFCSEGHEFLLVCRERNPEKDELMLHVVVTQHSRWTARRIHPDLFGQSLLGFRGDSWTCVSDQTISFYVSNRCKGRSQTSHTHILSSFTQQLSSTVRKGVRKLCLLFQPNTGNVIAKILEQRVVSLERRFRNLSSRFRHS